MDRALFLCYALDEWCIRTLVHSFVDTSHVSTIMWDQNWKNWQHRWHACLGSLPNRQLLKVQDSLTAFLLASWHFWGMSKIHQDDESITDKTFNAAHKINHYTTATWRENMMTSSWDRNLDFYWTAILTTFMTSRFTTSPCCHPVSNAMHSILSSRSSGKNKLLTSSSSVHDRQKTELRNDPTCAADPMCAKMHQMRIQVSWK